MSYSTHVPVSIVPTRRGRLDAASIGMLVALLAVSAGVAAFGSITSIASVDGWYADATKVPWSPPNEVFGPVWTVLYASMSVAAWLVWRRRYVCSVAPALALYVGQLFLISVWTPVFFGGYSVVGSAALWIGVVIIVVLDVCVIGTIIAFSTIRRSAALLLVPYLAWLLFATTLNIGTAVLNA